MDQRTSHSTRVGLACLLALVFVAPAQGIITWNVTFNDVANTTGVGFDDPALGATRRSTFNSVLGYLNTVLDETGNADIVVNDSQTDGSGSLASAGPFFFGGPPGFQNGFVYEHVTEGSDPSSTNPDATATFDFGYNWNSDTGSPTSLEFDLFSVSLHEVTHTLGFLSLLDSDGTSRVLLECSHPRSLASCEILAGRFSRSPSPRPFSLAA